MTRATHRAPRILTLTFFALTGLAAAQAPPSPFPGSRPSPAAHRAATPAASSLPQAATPQFSVAPGVYSGTQTISITDTTPGATIYYTTNGAYPGIYNTKYTAPIAVSQSEIVVAVAVATGYANSPFAIGRYIISSVPSSFVYTVAGNGSWGYSGDGGPATAAQIGSYQSLALDASGNLYISDATNNAVRKVTVSTGLINTIAGTGTAGTTGDGGPATSAELDDPQQIAVDSTGNIYVVDILGNIREISAADGTISTLMPKLGYVTGIALDAANNLYVNIGFEIQKRNASTGTITTLPQQGYPYMQRLAIDRLGNAYFCLSGYGGVEKLNAQTGAITLVAGSDGTVMVRSGTGDGGPAIGAQMNPEGLAFDGAGNLYILDANNAVREVQNGTITTVVGNWGFSPGGDGDPAMSVSIAAYFGTGIAVSPAGAIYIPNGNGRIWQATVPALPPTQTLPAPQFSVSAGTYSQTQDVAISSAAPHASIYVSTDGTIPVTSTGGYFGPIQVSGSMTITAVAAAPGYLPSAPASAQFTITSPPAATISTIAGSGHFGLSTSGGPALNVNLADPSWIVADPSGNVYFSDTEGCVVWKLTSSTGNLAIFAGTPSTNYSCSEGGDGGVATSAQIAGPEGLALDPAGNLYIADYAGSRIRKVDASTGIITTYAGPGTQNGGLGDGGPATSAQIPWPESIATDSAGNLYIADPGHGRVRMVSSSTGIISTIAGAGQSGPMGDGGPATSASMSPTRIKLDANGNIFILDGAHERLREVDAKTGIISTIAGNGVYGTSGNGGPATQAAASVAADIAIDASENVYLSTIPSQIRKIDAKTGIISQAFGTGYNGYSGDGGSASAASLNQPWGMTFDASGNLYFADTNNAVIRKITFPPPAAAPTFSPAAGAYTGVQSVTLGSSTANATIYYTTDGSTPDTGSTKYTGAITVGQSETISAIAVASGFAESALATAKYTITIPTPSIALTASINPVFTSNPVTFTATLTSTYGTPTGTVNFLDGSTQIGSATLSSGVAAFTTSALTVGPHSITAVYGGDANFTSVTSSALTETVDDFSFAPPSGGSTSATASWGGTATYTLTVTPPSGGSVSPITFSITGLPTGATATFNPASVPANSGPTTVTLTIQLPASAQATPHGVAPFGAAPLVLGFVLLPLLGMRKLRRALNGKMLILALALIAGAGLGSAIGCGGGGSGSSGGSNQQPQTYTLTVTATAGTLSHTETLTLNVQ
jgi:sugar lactone lactonase YvrE